MPKLRSRLSFQIPALLFSYMPESEQQEAYPHSSLPARGVVQLAAKLTSGLLPVTNQPILDVSLRPSDVAALKDNPESLALYMEASKLIQDEVYHALTRSNLRPTLFLHMKQLQVLGDGMIKQNELSFEAHRFDNYVVSRDAKGNPYYAIVRQYIKEHEIPENLRKTVKEKTTDAVSRQDGDLYPLYTELIRNMENDSWTSEQFIGDTFVPESQVTYKKDTFPY